MNKKIWLSVLAVIIVALATYLILDKRNPPITAAIFDPLNATYMIEGEPVTLVNGSSTTPVATVVFGQPVSGDLNGDGKADAAVILVQNPGGSGTFYYVAAAIDTSAGAQGTNAILLGDRIAPQNIEIQNGEVVANYADRKPGEPMTTQPSVGLTKYFTYNGSILQLAQ